MNNFTADGGPHKVARILDVADGLRRIGEFESAEMLRAFAKRIEAEGDGGAVAWQYLILDDKEGPSPHWHDMTREQFEMFRAAARSRYELRQLYTHPARSCVVSDEGVRDALNIFVGGNQYTSDHQCHRMRAALEHFAKGERHER